MPTNGVRSLFTVALLIVSAWQAPAVGEPASADPNVAPSSDGASVEATDAAQPLVNAPADRPDEEPEEPTEPAADTSPPAAQPVADAPAERADEEPEQPAEPATDTAAPRAESEPRAAVQLTYDEVRLEDVLNDISQLAGVNIVVNWRSLGDHNITRRTPVSFDLTGVSMAKVLDVLTDDLSGGRDTFGSVYWLVDDGLVRIATGSALNTTLDTRVFNVGDLLMLVPDFAGPRLNLDMSGSVYESTDAADDDAPSRAEAEEALIELVKDTIGEEMWQPAGKGSVSIRGEQMIVTQTRLGWLLMRRR